MGRRLIVAAILIFTLFPAVTFRSDAQGDANGNGLTVGYYATSCPKVEDIVTEVVARFVKQDQTLAPALLRLFFHDCFVKGCDASVLLDETPSGQPVEKKSTANGETIRGFDIIDEIKTQVEKECPKTVSCADILAFAAREAVNLSGLPRHTVPAGRHDSKTSRASDADVFLPTPKTSLDDIIHIFAVRNLTIEDLVVLLGAHSIGQAHCTQITDRLYKYNKDTPRDPSLNATYGNELAGKCPEGMPQDQASKTTLNLDPTTPLVLDVNYYQNLLQGRGLLQSDQVLATDSRTTNIVNAMAASSDTWSTKFLRAIIKMGRTNVLTEDEGEIRTNCRNFLKE